jgi:hypothetical protein
MLHEHRFETPYGMLAVTSPMRHVHEEFYADRISLPSFRLRVDARPPRWGVICKFSDYGVLHEQRNVYLGDPREEHFVPTALHEFGHVHRSTPVRRAAKLRILNMDPSVKFDDHLLVLEDEMDAWDFALSRTSDAAPLQRDCRTRAAVCLATYATIKDLSALDDAREVQYTPVGLAACRNSHLSSDDAERRLRSRYASYCSDILRCEPLSFEAAIRVLEKRQI